MIVLWFWIIVEWLVLKSGSLAIRLHIYNGWIFALLTVVHHHKLDAAKGS